MVGTKLHGDSFEFKPTHTLWFACNHLPSIKDASLAMWERVIVIPFGKTFLGEEQEKDLIAALYANLHTSLDGWAYIAPVTLS